MLGSNHLPLFLASTVLDFLVGGACLFVRPRRREAGGGAPTLGLDRAALAGVAVSAVFLLKLPMGPAAGVGFFGVIHLAYLDLVVLLPALGLLAAAAGLLPRRWRAARRLTPPVWLLAAAAVAMAPVGYHASFVEPFRLTVEQASVTIPAPRSGGAPLRLGVLADLQTDRVTDYERGAVERLLALAPDVILLPGDLFQGTEAEFERELPALRELLGRLAAPGGVYLVPGNTDRNASDVERAITGTAVRFLHNEVFTTSVNGWRLTLGGLGMRWQSQEAAAVVRRLEETPGQADCRILLAHYPDVVLDLLPGTRIDLVVAGHTHGGQVQLPFFGPPFTLSSVPRDVAAGGLHRLGERLIYVSRGVGCERGQAPRLRFLCPPEVSLITLVPGTGE